MESRMGRRMSKEVVELQNELKSLKDLKTIDDFQFDKLELTRGETPENVKERCIKLCQDYIGGDWLRQTVDTFEFKRLTGGMTNQLYYSAIGKPDSDSETPKEVAIRFYGPKYFNNLDHDGNERLTDVIIALMVSENQLGPKIYGIFEDGQIQHFYKHRQFRYDEQQNPLLVENVFRALAQVHSMDVPIKKNTNWVFKFLDECYEKDLSKGNELIEQYKLKTLIENPLENEVEWLKKAITGVNSQVTFTHNDFRGSNIMVTEPNDKIILIDFEYSSYGYRGFDFGTLIIEWNLQTSELFRSDMEILKKYPKDSELKTLFEIYIEEMVRINGKKYSEDPNNSVEQLIKETKVFSLMAQMFIILFCIKNDEGENDFPMDKQVMMEMAEKCYQGYFYFKEIFTRENVF